MSTKLDQSIEHLANDLANIEGGVLTEGITLATLMREGSTVTEHNLSGWGDGSNACALSAAYISLQARRKLSSE